MRPTAGFGAPISNAFTSWITGTGSSESAPVCESPALSCPLLDAAVAMSPSAAQPRRAGVNVTP